MSGSRFSRFSRFPADLNRVPMLPDLADLRPPTEWGSKRLIGNRLEEAKVGRFGVEPIFGLRGGWSG